jgi:hypothetical protein
MKHHNMLPYRRPALVAAAAALFIANASAQVWGGQSQEYCSNQNTGSDYSAGKCLASAHPRIAHPQLPMLTPFPQ